MNGLGWKFGDVLLGRNQSKVMFVRFANAWELGRRQGESWFLGVTVSGNERIVRSGRIGRVDQFIASKGWRIMDNDEDD